MGKRDHTENEILGLIEEEETKARREAKTLKEGVPK